MNSYDIIVSWFRHFTIILNSKYLNDKVSNALRELMKISINYESIKLEEEAVSFVNDKNEDYNSIYANSPFYRHFLDIYNIYVKEKPTPVKKKSEIQSIFQPILLSRNILEKVFDLSSDVEWITT